MKKTLFNLNRNEYELRESRLISQASFNKEKGGFEAYRSETILIFLNHDRNFHEHQSVRVLIYLLHDSMHKQVNAKIYSF